MNLHEPISRREFLHAAGRIGAALGLGTGLGGLLAACDKGTVATTTTATIAQGETSSTTEAPTSTTVSTSPERGRPIRIGVVSAKTGFLALFGKADEWWTDLGSRAVGDGIICGDGKLRAITLSVEDCRSDPVIAGRMAERLISDVRVDLVMCSGDADVVNGVAGRAEELGCPCIADFVQWQSFVFGREGSVDKPFTWTYAHAFGLEDVVGNYLAMWRQVPTNRKVGLVVPDTTDGRVWADEVTGLAAMASKGGYECVTLGPYEIGSTDFAEHIGEFVRGGCEIICCLMTTTEFISFWKQATELDYRPKIVTVGRGLLFPQAVEATGPSALHATAECLWQPGWPYRDSLTGRNAQELAEDYQLKTGQQWTPAIAGYAKFEWAVEAFKRSRSIIDKEQVIARIRTVKLDTCCGPLDFTTPVATVGVGNNRRPVQNVYKAPVGGVQWVANGMFDLQPVLVSRFNSPDLTLAGTVQSMEYQA